jgi:predicted PurR-regulated permease PerM
MNPLEPNATEPQGDSPYELKESRVTDHVIRLAFLGLFAYWSIGLVLPFVGIAIWSIILAVALYPLYLRLLRLVGGRQGLAATLLTLAVFSLVTGPVALLTANLFETLLALATSLENGSLKLPPPPSGLSEWPILGERVAKVWALASTNLVEALSQVWPDPRATAAALMSRLSGIGSDMVLFLVAILISGFLYKPGPRLVEATRLFAGRLVAPRGSAFIQMAGATIRSVSQGVIGIAFAQSLFAGVVLLAVGVPMAGLISFAILLLALVQIGPMPVLLPLVLWCWTTLPTYLAATVTAAAAVMFVMDNVLKPLLIQRGLKTPMLVVLAGVIGGTISHGMIGLFLGPVVLAVFYELVVAWTLYGAERPADAASASAAAAAGSVAEIG